MNLSDSTGSDRKRVLLVDDHLAMRVDVASLNNLQSAWPSVQRLRLSLLH